MQALELKNENSLMLRAYENLPNSANCRCDITVTSQMARNASIIKVTTMWYFLTRHAMTLRCTSLRDFTVKWPWPTFESCVIKRLINNATCNSSKKRHIYGKVTSQRIIFLEKWRKYGQWELHFCHGVFTFW